MRVSTKGRYALRFMMEVARSDNGGPVSLREVSRRQDISEKYLEQIVTHLSRAGLVRSVRGAGGGYLLTRPAAAYTVGDILRPMEGNLIPVECVSGSGCCDRADHCATIEVWEKIHAAVEGVVDSITLADLTARDREKGGAAAAASGQPAHGAEKG